MTALGFLILFAAIFVHAAYRTAKRRVRAQGLSVIVTRWLLGKPWHGDALTDAGWKREGRKALTRTGHASRFAHRPHRERIAIRTGSTLAVLAALYGLVFDRRLTLTVMAVAVVVSVLAGVWGAWRKYRRRKHRKSRLYPVHYALAPIVGHALPAKPESWLKIDPGPVVRWAEIRLPAGFGADPNQQKAICAAVVARTGIENPEPKWKLVGAKPVLFLKTTPPPPKKVLLADMMDLIEKAAPHQLVLGRGQDGVPIVVSLRGDSPHLGLSVGSGGGKSVTAELVGAQAAFRGATVLVLDFPKLVSLPALRHLPNVAYCDSAALVHSACVWLAHELEDRAEFVKQNTDYNGVLHGHLDPLLVIAEEQNALMNRLRAYWGDVRERGDPKRSPAIDGLELGSLMGRQLAVIMMQIAQMMTTRATGGGEARENLGIRLLGRATVNNWNVMVPEHPYPGKTKIPGRVHVVTDECRECQIIGITHAEARQLATAGVITPCPPNMPGRMRVPGAPHARVLVGGASPDQGIVLEEEPPVLGSVPGAVSLSEAVEMGIVTLSLHAVRKATQRDPEFPGGVGVRGLAKLYDPAQLAEWDAARR